MLARIGRALLRIAGWLLTPFAATLAAALGATITAMVAPTLSPTAGVAVAFAGGLAGAGLGLWLWVRILRGSPELRDVLAVTAEGVTLVGSDMERVLELFPILRQRRRQHAGTLSGGEQQMLAVARALMLGPRLLLLDEPSLGLAPLVVREIFRILRAVNEESRVSILLVEQNASLALDLADHVFLLETGRVVLAGTSDVLRRDDSIRRSYLGY